MSISNIVTSGLYDSSVRASANVTYQLETVSVPATTWDANTGTWDAATQTWGTSTS